MKISEWYKKLSPLKRTMVRIIGFFIAWFLSHFILRYIFNNNDEQVSLARDTISAVVASVILTLLSMDKPPTNIFKKKKPVDDGAA